MTQRKADEEGKTKEFYKQQAVDQKVALSDLARQKNRPDPARDWPSEVYVLARNVVDKWKAFIK